MSAGYISDELRARVREQADDRCGYCLSPQKYVMGKLEIEHIIPTSHDGTDDEDNLWLSCRMCNNYKGSQTQALDPVSGDHVPLFNPRHQKWSAHFSWSNDGIRIVGQTASRRATVLALQLNNEIALMVRSHWVTAGWHPPDMD